MVEDTFSIEQCLTIANTPNASPKAVSDALKWIVSELAKEWEIDYFFQVSCYVFRCYVKDTSKVNVYFCDDELNLSIPQEKLRAYCDLYRHLETIDVASNK